MSFVYLVCRPLLFLFNRCVFSIELAISLLLQTLHFKDFNLLIQVALFILLLDLIFLGFWLVRGWNFQCLSINKNWADMLHFHFLSSSWARIHSKISFVMQVPIFMLCHLKTVLHKKWSSKYYRNECKDQCCSAICQMFRLTQKFWNHNLSINILYPLPTSETFLHRWRFG